MALWSRIKDKGMEKMGVVLGKVLANERVMAAMGKAMAGSLKARDAVAGAWSSALGAAGIPRTDDLRKLSQRLSEIERKLADIEESSREKQN